ncbi:Pentatricopeptide repeat-containing protein [Thalictrum thalictroides]|uniref:Pentatricopeptide repeat-containing protein n=1 Tax=Thalictrum thalictroides TaxID=46969 RepID=A0A7J6VZK4_THATH|nr:Pentatricopeptide repeat-containing protein [Thalictrum thalictroides]
MKSNDHQFTIILFLACSFVPIRIQEEALCMASLPLHTTPSHSKFSYFQSTKTRENLILKQTHSSQLYENEKNSQFLYKSYFHHISSLCKQSRILEAVELLNEMDFKEFQIGPEIYGELLQGCVYERALFTGKQIHARILKNGDFFSKNEYIETKLLIFYAKCHLLSVSNELFYRLRKQNVFSWAAMIGLHCRMGSNEEALKGFCEMLGSGFFPDNFVVPIALKACSALQFIEFGKGIHGYVLKMGYGCCVFVASSLVDMYGKCRVLDDAKKIFDDITERNVVTWNSMVVGYAQNGMNDEAIRIFYDMRVEGIEPTCVTVASFLSASANLDAIEEGKQGHAIAVISGLELNNIFGSSLINFYSKVGLIEDAELVFNEMAERDGVTWNLLISGFVQIGQVEKALDTCRQMKSENFRFDSVTLASLLSASADTRNLELGKVGHGHCVRNNLVSDVVVASSIVDMYSKCGKINNARWVFNSTKQKDLALWNTLIAAYAEWGFSGEALKLFHQMQLEGVVPNVVSWNLVIMGFFRLGQVVEAENMFAWMQSSGMKPSVITYTTHLSGMCENGFADESISLFKEMQAVGLQPNTASIIGVLSACVKVVSLEYGKAIHGYIIRHGFFSSILLWTSIIDMYAKCGILSLAKKVFDIQLSKELPLYNVMISGYAMHGRAVDALALYKEMQEERIKPDGITFTAVLLACSHAGLVGEGLEVFTKMFSVYHVNPSMEHYGCVVSLLSRCGTFDEALKLVQVMPFDPDDQILGSLLSSCKYHGAIELGEYLSRHMFKL